MWFGYPNGNISGEGSPNSFLMPTLPLYKYRIFITKNHTSLYVNTAWLPGLTLAPKGFCLCLQSA